MLRYEVIRHKGLDGKTWYVIFRLDDSDPSKRVRGIVRTTDKDLAIQILSEAFDNQ